MQMVRATDDTFCILVLGDFLGEDSVPLRTGGVDWSALRATPDTVMRLAGLRPRIKVSLGDDGTSEEEVAFSTLQDFHPAELFKGLSLFEPFREAREAARRGDATPATPIREPEDRPSPPGGKGGSFLDAILEVAEPPGERAPLRTPEELKDFVRDVVRPHLVTDDSDALRRVAAVDEVASLHLSRLIHDESFQRLEGVWRSLVFLLSRVDTTGRVRVYLAHLPRATLESDLEAGPAPEESRLFHLLSDPDLPAPGKRWAMVAGAYEFGFSPLDIRLLGRIARVARAADIPWISGAEPQEGEPSSGARPDAGQDPEEEPPPEWARLRERTEADWVGLTYPRFLLREPYGETQARGKDLHFREETASWGDLLWGHGAVLVATLMAQGFVTEGWSFSPERYLEVGGMPLGAPGGDTAGKPRSVSVALTPTDARKAVDMGVMPLVGVPGRAGVRVGGVHAVSGPGVTPSAWWRR